MGRTRSFLRVVCDVEDDFLLADYASLAYTGGLASEEGAKKVALARYVAKRFINYVQEGSYVRTDKRKFVCQNYRLVNPYDLTVLWNSLDRGSTTTVSGMDATQHRISEILYGIFYDFDIPKIFNPIDIDEDEVVRLSNWLDIIKDEPRLSSQFALDMPPKVVSEFNKVETASLSYSIEELEKDNAIEIYKSFFPSDIYQIEKNEPELFKKLAYINKLCTQSVIIHYNKFNDGDDIYSKKVHLLRQLTDLSVDKVIYRKQENAPIYIEYSDDDSDAYRRSRQDLEMALKSQSAIIEGLHMQIENRDKELKTITAPANATISEQQDEIARLQATIDALHNENVELEMKLNRGTAQATAPTDTEVVADEDAVSLKDVYGFSETKAIEEVLIEATEEDFGDSERRNAMPVSEDYANKFADRLEKLYSISSLLKFVNGVNPKVVKRGLEILKERNKANA